MKTIHIVHIYALTKIHFIHNEVCSSVQNMVLDWINPIKHHLNRRELEQTPRISVRSILEMTHIEI